MDIACRGSWLLIEERCNWVTCGPCTPHVGDLEIGDICKLPRCKAHIQRAASIRNFIRDHSHVYAALKSLDCKLLTKLAPTRMAGVMYGLDVMQSIKKRYVSAWLLTRWWITSEGLVTTKSQWMLAKSN